MQSYEAFSERLKKRFEENPETGFEEVMDLIEGSFGFNNGDSLMQLTDYEILLIKEAYQRTSDWAREGMPEIESSEGGYDEYDILYSDYEPITVTCTRILANKAGFSWTSFYHTGIPVPVRAVGAGQEYFSGSYDNTDIPKKIAYLMKVQLP